jgi:hypothetical protein
MLGLFFIGIPFSILVMYIIIKAIGASDER